MEYKGTLKLAQVIIRFVCVFVYHINICIFTWKELTKNLTSTSVFLPKESLNVNLLICLKIQFTYIYYPLFIGYILKWEVKEKSNFQVTRRWRGLIAWYPNTSARSPQVNLEERRFIWVQKAVCRDKTCCGFLCC